MNSSIDLNLLLLAQQAGNPISELPDLYAVTPPRHTARGRDADSLIIYLSMTGNSPLSVGAHTQLLEQLAHKFYKTTGSLTAAMRTIVESLNLYLLDRNLHSTSMGRQGIGQLLLVALRGNILYMAQCGVVHAFVVTPNETLHLHDQQSSGRGLGFSRTAPIRFLQVKLAPGDFMVLSTKTSPNWSEITLRNPQGVETLRNQLLENAGQDFNAVIIQAQEGTGKLRLLRRKAEALAPTQAAITEPSPGPAITETPTTPIKIQASYEENNKLDIPPDEMAPQAIVPEVEADKQPDEPIIPTPTAESIKEKTEDQELEATPQALLPSAVEPVAAPTIEADTEPVTFTQPSVPEKPVVSEVETAYPGIKAEELVPPTQSIPTPSIPARRPRRERRLARPNPFTKYLASIQTTLGPTVTAIVQALRSALGTIGAATLRLLKNLLPDSDVLHVPSSVMVFFAIAIPLILAVAGGMVFLQRGRAQQYQIFYQQATEQAANAASLTNPLEQRLALKAAITDLDKAEYYTVTSQSQELRKQVTSQLDSLDAVKRLDYKQAIVGGLAADIHVIRMVATTTDLYMLNGQQGNVIHAIMTGRGYEIDPNFQCGPTYGPINVGPLVDITELPPGSFENASLLGMDANGNLLYCVIDAQPYSAVLAPPNTGFGDLSGMSLDQGDLYMLDPNFNAVWIYRNMEVTQQPHLFFGESVPPMQDVIDLTVYNDDLFLLHADGHITKCTYSALLESPTRCDDPYPYSDNRPGRVHSPVIDETVFNQLYFSSFPERSIYMLDPQNQSIYYFSVLLALQWQYQPLTFLTSGNATAFAISPNRMAFLAIGSNVYYAAIP
jgi:uncharacterized membrane protein